jgi:hypothetical protein
MCVLSECQPAAKGGVRGGTSSYGCCTTMYKSKKIFFYQSLAREEQKDTTRVGIAIYRGSTDTDIVPTVFFSY